MDTSPFDVEILQTAATSQWPWETEAGALKVHATDLTNPTQSF